MSARSTLLPGRVALAPVVATSLGFFLVQLDVTIVNVALDRMAAGLATGVAGLQWVVNAYTCSFAALLLSAGALGDRWGARRGFLLGLVVFTAASLACGAAPGLAVLVAARAAQGIGAAFLMACSLSLLTHAHPDDAARARAVGIWTAIGGMAVAAGPVFGGALVDAFGWRSIFLVNLPVGAAALLLVLGRVDDPPGRPGRHLDLRGQALAIAALGLATATIIEAGPLGWRHPAVLAGAVLASAALAGFARIESRAAEPMLPPALLARADVAAPALIGGLVSLAFYGLIFVLSLFFQQAKGYSPLRTGLAFLPLTAAVTVANVAGGQATARLGPRLPLVAGLLLSVAGYLSLLGVDAATPYAALWWRLLALPLGIGVAVPALTAALLAAVERARSGLASGILTALRQAGAAVGVALDGALVGGRGVEAAILPVAALAAGASTLGVVVALRVGRRGRRGAEAD